MPQPAAVLFDIPARFGLADKQALMIIAVLCRELAWLCMHVAAEAAEEEGVFNTQRLRRKRIELYQVQGAMIGIILAYKWW